MKRPSKKRHLAERIIAGGGGRKPIHFHEGGLHASTDTRPGQKISAAKHAAAASGKEGPLAEKQERFYENVLSHHK